MDFFKLFSSKPSPKDVAKERLQLILIHDRSDVSPELLEILKSELLKVISNYAEFDSQEIEIKLTKQGETEGNSSALVASIPIKNMKRKV